MGCPEYYLTRCELEIISTQFPAIFQYLELEGTKFDLVELGSGDGTKTLAMLEPLLKVNGSMCYVPIDISASALSGLVYLLDEKFPQLQCAPIHAEYFNGLLQLKETSKASRLVLFLGSNIGNFNEEKADDFAARLFESLQPGDCILMGFDLKKNPITILAAYNDKAGLTKAFNLNLLNRMNRELGADFDLIQWEHFPTYDPHSGLTKSFLVSKLRQAVHIEALGRSFLFETGETIHTEISRKFSFAEIENLLSKAGFGDLKHFVDCKHYFSLSAARKL